MRRNNFSLVLKKIRDDCIEWNEDGKNFYHQEILLRDEQAHSLKEKIRYIISFFMFPIFKNKKKIYFFQGLRHAYYFQYFDKSSIFIIGSKEEKEFAVKNGFGFVSSLPIISSVKSYVYRDSEILINKIFSRWMSRVKNLDSAIFFIYEDTQPLGTFLNYLSKECSKNSHAICIQHAFYAKPNFPMRLEGRNTEFNFTIDRSQTKLIQPNFSKTSIIGLPFRLQAETAQPTSVILVGVGGVFYDNQVFEDSLAYFKKIHSIISNNFNLNIIYRPHPNERRFPEVMKRLTENFKVIDDLDIIDRLNSPSSIFIGVASSVLFQAEIAGHSVACFHADPRQQAVLSENAGILKLPNFENLVQWVELVQKESHIRVTETTNQTDPFKIFAKAMDKFYAEIGE